MYVFILFDFVVVVWFLVVWLGFNLLIDVSLLCKKIFLYVMDEYCCGWMVFMVGWDVCIMDMVIMFGL